MLYRLNFRLDDRGPGNQCGIFADLEDLTLSGGIDNATSNNLRPGSFTFLQAEKPLLFDVVGRGLTRGRSQGWTKDRMG